MRRVILAICVVSLLASSTLAAIMVTPDHDTYGYRTGSWTNVGTQPAIYTASSATTPNEAWTIARFPTWDHWDDIHAAYGTDYTCTLKATWVTTAGPNNAGHNINVDRMTDASWDELVATWNGPGPIWGPNWWGGAGTPNSVNYISETWTAGDATWEVDATALAKSWDPDVGAATNRGLRIHQTGNTGSNLWVAFASKEHTTEDPLQLIFTPEPATLAVLAIGGILGLIRRRS